MLRCHMPSEAASKAASYDVVVVGGGVIGCAVAYRLTQRGAGRVLVLERSIPGAEASSAAAGILGAQIEAEAPGPFADLLVRSRSAWTSFAHEIGERSGIDVGYWRCGALRLAFDGAGERRLAAVAAWQGEKGLRVERVSPEEAVRIEPVVSPHSAGGIFCPDEAQVEPRLLMRALGRAAARAGVCFESAYVKRILAAHGRVEGVELDWGKLACGAVVLAAGSWSSLIEGAPLPPRLVRPMRGQMIELSARTPEPRHILDSGRGYLVPRRDGRIVAGSTMEQAGFQKEVTAGGLAAILGLALELAPSLKNVPVEGFWSNFRPHVEDGRPVLGPSELGGLFLATGHFRNGILLAPVTAELLADCLLGGKGDSAMAELAPFSIARFRGG